MKLAPRAQCPSGRLVSRVSRLFVLGSNTHLSQVHGICEDRGSGLK